MENKDYSTESLINSFTGDRRIILNGSINEQQALRVILTLYELTKEDPNKPIYLYINSLGGDIQYGLAIIDTIHYISAPVYTFCYAMAASMGAVILAAGDKRFAYEHATIMVHQPWVGLSGPTNQTSLTEAARKLEEERKKIETLLCKFTKGKTSFEDMHKACDFDNFMPSSDALKMGLIDEIVKGEKKNIN